MIFPCHFEYNNADSQEWDLRACAFNSSTYNDSSTGLDLTPVIDSLTNRDIDYGAKNDSRLTFDMTLIHKLDLGRTFSRDEIREISSWLLTSNINWLKLYNNEYGDYWCLGRFTSISKTRYGNDTPALTVTFTSVYSYFYSDIITRSFDVNGTLSANLYYNGDELENYIHPNITFTNLSGSEVTIQNTQEDTAFSLSGLSSGEIITIDGQNLIMYSNMTTSSLGVKVFGDSFNRHWVKMYRGKNTFNLSGNFTIDFMYRESRRIGEF